MQSALTLQDLCTTVIEALERTNQLDDTYLIFTSDNGYGLGLHRIKETKGNQEKNLLIALKHTAEVLALRAQLDGSHPRG
jgi:N-acetylglucosamine-6-sulfatase